MKEKIAIGSDHAGYKLKEYLKQQLSGEYEFVDAGTHNDESADYPDFAHPVAEQVAKRDVSRGILICGSGNGINITANKHAGIRAALCWNPEVAVLARQHNDANIVSLPARYLDNDTAKEIVKAFLETQFEGGRHQRRIDKIDCV